MTAALLVGLVLHVLCQTLQELLRFVLMSKLFQLQELRNEKTLPTQLSAGLNVDTCLGCIPILIFLLYLVSELYLPLQKKKYIG